ncbi:PREDICTED: potassium voltage-gated channel subfamily G member 4-like [Poecilia mexicana]|nr:PREDICTED: potassium voltage-gated channel subfamily G member 4-like [Poecilia mexicana]XP_014830553.1 PREDICTED: potassium voltage-gated channel subfamily G member 4-like [Poecilia mexicana]XP_014830554.1 PREDICTED: potassium voltage-gated channel subfamily G member 4-like [Poecilia mexicana]XP_014830555.1 PREDICTED: potassium voltage-gated channel subfamily G member 4-like [Poecilia mexicana]
MPIISNANHDFSTYSISSDDSSLDRFFTEIPETETLKGVYFQRAQLLREPQASFVVDHAVQVLINVGGNRYAFPWSTLEQFPQSRLARLRSCTTPEEIARLCDDYDETCREFFFDRNPTAFRVILNFLAAGKLRLLRELCAVSLHDELDYWGVDPGHMERCCRRRMITRVDEVAERRRKEEEWRQKRMKMKKRPPQAEKGYRRLVSALREVMENPHSGLAGKIFACLSIIMVLVTVVSLCISTMPDLRDEENRGECSQKCRNMFVVESVCVAWFTLEFLLRFVNAPSKLAFARGPLNVIDAIAILPYYVSLVFDVGEEAQDEAVMGAGRGYLDKLSLILRLLRALRILYVMRLARHSLGLQTLGVTMQRSMREFGLLLLFVCVAVALFSPLVHLAESELAPFAAAHPQHSFSSIPASYWWAIISMTTVGYGDMVPRSVPGQMVALISILSGILIMAFPATSIFHTFSRSYQELKQEYERVWKQESHEEMSDFSQEDFSSASKKESEGMTSNETHRSTLPPSAF